MRLIIQISLVVAIILQHTSAQTEITIGLIGGIDYYNYSFWGFPDSVNNNNQTMALPKGNHKMENLMNYSAGLMFTFQKKQWLLQTIMAYSSKDYLINYDLPDNIINGDKVVVIDFSKNRLRYADLSIRIGYNFLSETQFNIAPLIGLSGSYLLMADSYFALTDGKTYIDKNETDAILQHQISDILWAVQGGLNISYQVTEKINFLLEGTLYQYLIQASEVPMDRNPIALSARMGITYKM